MRLVELDAPTPIVGIEIAEVFAVAIDPAQVERRVEADRHSKRVAIADAEVERSEPAHRHSRQHMCLALGANGIVFAEKAPHVSKDPAFEISRLAIEEKAARVRQARL